MSYYVVNKGKNIGIYNTWAECKENVTGINAIYKKFDNENDANDFLVSDYSNNGKKWSNYEEEKLVKEIQDNKTIKEISTLHKRTPGSITCKIKILVVDDFINNNHFKDINQNIEDINLKYKTNYNEIDIQLLMEKNKKKNKNKDINTKIYDNTTVDYNDTTIDYNQLLNRCNKLEKELYEIKNILITLSFKSP
jgi:viroplasmin and RNaseH domain-containing protein